MRRRKTYYKSRKATTLVDVCWRDRVSGRTETVWVAPWAVVALDEIARKRGALRSQVLRELQASKDRPLDGRMVEQWLIDECGIVPEKMKIPPDLRLSWTYSLGRLSNGRYKFVTVRAPRWVYDAIRAEAAVEGVSVSEICRRVSPDGKAFAARAKAKYQGS